MTGATEHDRPVPPPRRHPEPLWRGWLERIDAWFHTRTGEVLVGGSLVCVTVAAVCLATLPVWERTRWLRWSALAVPLLVARWRSRRARAAGRRLLVGWFLFGAYAVPVGLLGALAVNAWWTDWRHRRDFDAALWRSTPASRLWMADDLVADDVLPGRTASEVVALLGAAASSDMSRSRRLEWDLGEARGRHAAGNELLVVEFGADGRVTRPWIDFRSW